MPVKVINVLKVLFIFHLSAVRYKCEGEMGIIPPPSHLTSNFISNHHKLSDITSRVLPCPTGELLKRSCPIQLQWKHLLL